MNTPSLSELWTETLTYLGAWVVTILMVYVVVGLAGIGIVSIDWE